MKLSILLSVAGLTALAAAEFKALNVYLRETSQCEKCAEDGPGSGMVYTDTEYKGKCVCFKAQNECLNFADVGINDQISSFTHYRGEGSSGCRYFLHGNCDAQSPSYTPRNGYSSSNLDYVDMKNLNNMLNPSWVSSPGYNINGKTWSDNFSSVICYD